MCSVCMCVRMCVCVCDSKCQCNVLQVNDDGPGGREVRRVCVECVYVCLCICVCVCARV